MLKTDSTRSHRFLKALGDNKKFTRQTQADYNNGKLRFLDADLLHSADITEGGGIYELLKSKSEEVGRINFFDTQSLQVKRLLIFRMFWMILRSNKLVYVPAHNNLKYLFPFIYAVCKISFSKFLFSRFIGNTISDSVKH